MLRLCLLTLALVRPISDAALRIFDFFLHLASRINPTSAAMVGITTMYEIVCYMDSKETCSRTHLESNAECFPDRLLARLVDGLRDFPLE